MHGWVHRPAFLVAGAAALVLGLTSILVLQARWVEELSQAERQSLQSTLHTRLESVAEDLNRELTRAFLVFQQTAEGPGPRRAQLAKVAQAWNATAPNPRLVRELWLVTKGMAGDFQFERYLASSRDFAPLPVPEQMEAIRPGLEELLTRGRSSRPGPPRWDEMLLEPLPALAYLMRPEPVDEPSFKNLEEQRQILIVLLDRDVLLQQIVPDAIERHFGEASPVDFQLRLRRKESPGQVLYETGALPQSKGQPDDTVELFGLLPPERRGPLERELGSLRRFPRGEGHRDEEPQQPLTPPQHDGPDGQGPDREDWRGPGGPPPWHGEPRGEDRPPPREAMGPAGPRKTGRRFWVLEATHQQGSVAAAVQHNRYRNTALGLGAALILAGGSVLVFLALRASQALARQQMEFVAGVTHEWMTPLSALRSAGRNLAAGIVVEPEKIRRYGGLVEDQSRRLADLVGQVLEFAGVQSGLRRYQSEPLSVDGTVHAAIEDCRGALEQAGFTLEVAVESPLPPVLGDAEALRRAVRNLIENALRHAVDGLWLRVQARPAGDQVEIRVEDHGAGVPREEMRTIFEPFRRGQRALDDQIPGSGLGLSLVRGVIEAHKGRLNVDSTSEGAAFTIRLPAAPTGEAT